MTANTRDLPITAEVGSEGGSLDRTDDTASGMVRYPTEPPSPPDATEGRQVIGNRWRNGLIGVAAGTAALIGVSKLRRRG